MKKSLEALILLAGALGGVLLLMVHSVWWQVISFALERHAGAPGVLFNSNWRSFDGLGRIVLGQAQSAVGLGEWLSGAVLGGASALAWRCRKRGVDAAASSCAWAAWLVLMPVLMWNVCWLFSEGISARLSARVELVGLLGFVLNLKLWWAAALLALPMRDHKRQGPQGQARGSGRPGAAST